MTNIVKSVTIGSLIERTIMNLRTRPERLEYFNDSDFNRNRYVFIEPGISYDRIEQKFVGFRDEDGRRQIIQTGSSIGTVKRAILFYDGDDNECSTTA